MANGTVFPRSSTLSHCSPPPFIAVMVQNTKLLRALQRIADTSRKLSRAAVPAPGPPCIPTLLKSLPEHRPLLPVLVSQDIPANLAKVCADRYDVYASQLRSETETKLAPYLVNLCKNPPARVYSIFLNSYSQTLQRWAQSILNTALKSLKRDSVELQNWDVTYPAPLWLPVRPPRMSILEPC